MKRFILQTLLIGSLVLTMNSCSSDGSELNTVDTKAMVDAQYTYSDLELETMDLINEYRVSVGLNALEKINYISCKSEVHDNYMILNNVVNHDDFEARAEDIVTNLGAKRVGENIAYNYRTPAEALKAWLASPGHKKNIEGDFTHFGLAIRENATTGKKYYTNIFAKI
ncbi:CAP domain-containing protein [Flavobacterium muglaense]|uniref:CAP domain-containing protein n=1 Tax=Flavobacterium muglaense TaxID=2764716 RepID=A0A923SJT5_9FLAO|nr:CAP domain-containing protein [Flavobacterium muglaense]MBC5838054.1 CAP domain-containing protein [Flavobacterium muglaense]MBC5844588.1 CAP domain-containing protein [Flavobacterium muglaense]